MDKYTGLYRPGDKYREIQTRRYGQGDIDRGIETGR